MTPEIFHRNCPSCGRLFQTAYASQLYCDVLCSQRARDRRRRDRARLNRMGSNAPSYPTPEPLAAAPDSDPNSMASITSILKGEK